MLGKREQGMTVRYILWSVFYINIILFVIAIWVSSSLLLVLCLLLSLFVIMLGNKHQEYSTVFEPSSEYSFFKRVSFFNYLKSNLFKKDTKTANGRGVIRKDSIDFSVNPALPKKEYLVHSRVTSDVHVKKNAVEIGSTQCNLPYDCGIFNFDLAVDTHLSKEMKEGLIAASSKGEFAVSMNEYSFIKNEKANCLLKVPVNMDLEQSEIDIDKISFQKLFSQTSVRGIELYLNIPGNGSYSLTEFMGRKNNIYFHSIPGLLNFVQRLREFAGGKPVGIRIGIGIENEFRELCRVMKERHTFLDFISIIGDDATNMEKGTLNKSLEYAIAFVSETIKEFQLDQEIKIIAIGKVENGFVLLKLLSLGADSCMNQITIGNIDEISNSYFNNSAIAGIKKNLLSTHRMVVKEAVQLMKYAGFDSIEDVHPKKFFQQDEESGIKNFEEIYFKNKSCHAHDLVKNFMYN